jgi:ethanolamine permease
MERRVSGVAKYEDVGEDSLQRRRLRKCAGWVLLWALGVGAVISGDFGGWNYGLKHGGFGGLAIGTLLMAAMYVCIIYTIAELSAALPHAGGFFSFTRNAFGPLGGFVCGLTDTIEYVLTPAVIVFVIGGYMEKLVPEVPAPAWWAAYYVVFVGINVRGVELTLKVGLVVTLAALAVLVTFYVSLLATGSFSWELLFRDKAGHETGWLPGGTGGVYATLPFAIWFYLAIEQLPLAAEESHDVARDMPKALILGIATLLL